MPSFDEMATFVCDELGLNRPLVTAATSLQDDIGLYGADIDDFLIRYSERFGVDMTGFLWYFHTGEEGFSPGSILFRSPDARVQRIPITVGMLLDFANQKRWAIEYPKHQLPRWRLDIIFNLVLILGMMAYFVTGCLWKLSVGS